MANVNLDVRIMAVYSRKEYAEHVAERVGISKDRIVYDDRGYSGGGNCWYNAKRIWHLPKENYTHRLILCDDAIPCNNLMEHMYTCLGKYPDAIWTFYNGVWIKPSFKKKDSPYCRVKGCKMGGLAICMPIDMPQEMIEYTDNYLGVDFPHDDGRTCFYAVTKGIDVMCTIPTMTDHLQIDSVIPHHSSKRRFSSTFQEDVEHENWDSDEVNSTYWVVNDIWLPKDHPRKALVERMLANAKKKQEE